ncbi:uncharacterized protein LOC121749508 [Salvia splendens]|uniref:uncharacterized protein LOC121749508 n=1 Tax=Salvia splendens TaxID=180675 RepID=UPI001C252860|nr:uncharacterized protein LOC121749508 [Salvia splendens]
MDFIREGTWDEPKLRLFHAQAPLSQRAIEQILDTPIVAKGPDIPRWNLSRFGDFSLATTWETIRAQRPIIWGLDDIWKAGLTTSISIFIWRLLSNRIPVDTKLQWRKMEMASKFQCCPHSPGIESLRHLFIQGSGTIRVQTFIQNSMATGNIKPKHWKGVKLKMSIPSKAETRLPRPLAMPIKWHPPDGPSIKINTDGAYSEASGKAGGRGIIRDSMGKMISAFAEPLDAHSALEAELKAAHLGLSLAQELTQPMLLEMDSEQALNLLNSAS